MWPRGYCCCQLDSEAKVQYPRFNILIRENAKGFQFTDVLESDEGLNPGLPFLMRVSKDHSFSYDQKNENQSSTSVFRFSILKNNLENKISIYFKFIKGPTVFRARDKRKTDFETNFVFHFLKESLKKVTLAQTSFGTSFSGVGSGRSTPSGFSIELAFKNGCS